MAPSSGTKSFAHVAPLNSPGATCAVTGWGTWGNDYRIEVLCTRNNQAFDTRFMAGVYLASGTQNTNRGFATVFSGSIQNSNSWSSKGATPTVTALGSGSYSVRFPDLINTATGGNAQVTSNQGGVSCRLTSWLTSSSGTQVDVYCQNSALQGTDARFMVSFAQSLWSFNGSGAAVFADQPTFEGSYAPSDFYMMRMSSQPVTILHSASQPGQYIVTFAPSGFGATTRVEGQVTAWNGSANCSFADIDDVSARVVCINLSTGQPQDSVFSFQVSNTGWSRFSGFAQIPVAGTNWKSTAFDAGNGLICGEGVTGLFANKVACAGRGTPGSTGALRLIGGAAPSTGSVKSIAVDNIDATATRVLALGSDNIVRASSGNISDNSAWPSSTNFGSWSTYVPAVNTSGASVSLKKIVVVRTQNAAQTDLVALTTAGTLLEMTTVSGGGRAWRNAVNYSFGSGVTLKDISHGRHDLYALQTNNIMIRIVRATSFGGLNSLPAGLLPVAMGGRHVLTNAGRTSAGAYPCTAPKNSSGYYNCAGDSNREYRWNLNNTGTSLFALAWPTTDQTDVLTSGQPFVSSGPGIVDADMFEGNLGAMIAWQYFSRLYQHVP